MLNPCINAMFTSLLLLQAYQTSNSLSLAHDIVATLEGLWQTHSKVGHPMKEHCSEGYKELSSALVGASQSRLLLQGLGQKEQKLLLLALPGPMVAAVVTADEGPPASWHGIRWAPCFKRPGPEA
jgi:hypothetical protein